MLFSCYAFSLLTYWDLWSQYVSLGSHLHLCTSLTSLLTLVFILPTFTTKVYNSLTEHKYTSLIPLSKQIQQIPADMKSEILVPLSTVMKPAVPSPRWHCFLCLKHPSPNYLSDRPLFFLHNAALCNFLDTLQFSLSSLGPPKLCSTPLFSNY